MRLTTKIGATLGASVLIVAIATMAWAAGAGSSTGSQPQNLHPAVARPNAFIDTSTEAKYSAVNPCRIADTRAAGGRLSVGLPRMFQVSGTTGFSGQGGHSTGCNVPAAATAVAATVVAVNESGAGFLVGWPSGSPQPASSFLNYNGPGLVSSGVTLSINQTIAMVAGVSGTDVVIDIDGYYITPMWAEVSSAGGLVRASRAVAASHIGTGSYEVDFDRDISGCAYNATSYFYGTIAEVEPRSGNVTGVFVAFADYNGTSVDSYFYITVTC